MRKTNKQKYPELKGAVVRITEPLWTREMFCKLEMSNMNGVRSWSLETCTLILFLEPWEAWGLAMPDVFQASEQANAIYRKSPQEGTSQLCWGPHLLNERIFFLNNSLKIFINFSLKSNSYQMGEKKLFTKEIVGWPQTIQVPNCFFSTTARAASSRKQWTFSTCCSPASSLSRWSWN